jgi:phosphate transport system substrate-binding protein
LIKKFGGKHVKLQRHGILACLAVTATLALAACGSDNPSSNNGGGGGSSAPANAISCAQGSIKAQGSTAQGNAMTAWIKNYQTACSSATIDYQATGSGAGQQAFIAGTADFAGSDSAIAAADQPKADARCKSGPAIHLPMVVGPIAVVFNVSGVSSLQLKPATIAKIFSGKVTTWNDPAIAADNPGVKLPGEAITVAHRSDGSGTTQNFTEYLNSAASGVWKLKSGATVEWPADTQAGNGNPGVAQIVKSTKGAIGYVDLSDAKASGLKYAAIKNQAGKFVLPTADAASAAGDGIEIKDNPLFSALNAKGEASYPITCQTWVIVYKKQTDKAKATALKSYLKFLVADGQKLLKDIDYAPLPKSLSGRAVKQLDLIQAP